MIRESSSIEWEIKQEKIKKDMSEYMKAEYKSFALAHPEMNEEECYATLNMLFWKERNLE